jgi:hypothetical protein
VAWTTPDTRSAGDVLSAANYNIYLRDNLNYLFSGRPKFSVLRDNGGDYTTTSTTFVDVDGTNLKGTLTISGSAVLLGFTCQFKYQTTTAYLDFTVDGVRVGAAGADGLIYSVSGAAYMKPFGCFIALATGLSVGSHTFKVVWKSYGGTSVMHSGNGVSGEDFIPHFWGIEVA